MAVFFSLNISICACCIIFWLLSLAFDWKLRALMSFIICPPAWRRVLFDSGNDICERCIVFIIYSFYWKNSVFSYYLHECDFNATWWKNSLCLLIHLRWLDWKERCLSPTRYYLPVIILRCLLIFHFKIFSLCIPRILWHKKITIFDYFPLAGFQLETASCMLKTHWY